jgi:hypothetical protein
MRTVFSVVLAVAWALWFGGIVALFLFVSVLFKADRPTAMRAAPEMFYAFEKYQIVLAAVCLIAAVALRITTKAGVFAVVFLFLAVATVGACAEPMFISSKMEKLREMGQSGSAEFKKLHGYSMVVYVAQAVALLGAGLFLPAAMAKQSDSGVPPLR